MLDLKLLCPEAGVCFAAYALWQAVPLLAAYSVYQAMVICQYKLSFALIKSRALAPMLSAWR